VLWAVLNGRLGLEFVVVFSLVLFWSVAALMVYMAFFRAYHRARLAYRGSRAALYQPSIELALMEEPLDVVAAALAPRRVGDADIAQEVAVEAMRHLEGAPYETLRMACFRHGFAARDVEELRSSNRHKRGRALDRLGVLRPPQASEEILSVLAAQPLDLKLVALRSLAAIGDRAVLPRLVEEADRLPPPLLPRMASLLFEFGPAGRSSVVELVNRHPREFPPAAVADILRQLASDFESAA
jgi:hypothetical protein